MKKRIVSKRLLAVLLALSMCLSLLPVAALAEETETGGGQGTACVCSSKCGGDSLNMDCPVCAADAEQCEGAAPILGEPSDAEEPSDEEPPAEEPPAEEPPAEEPSEEAPSEEEPSAGEGLNKAPSNGEMNVLPGNTEPRSGETWDKVEWNAIQSGGTYVIAMTKSDGNSWMLPSATTN